MKRYFAIIVTLVLLLAPVPKTEAASKVFADVPTNHPNYTAIMYLLENKIIEPNKRFGLNDKVTREEVAIMVAKATGLDGTKKKTKFKDVPATRYSSGYIYSAVQAKIINGYPDGTFKPTQKVTRGHMAAFIANGFKLTKEKDIQFKDVKKGSTAYNAVRKLVYESITSGYPDGTFRPNETLTRSHIAAFIARAMDPAFRPSQSVTVTRGIHFGMNPTQVKSIESKSPAVFVVEEKEGNATILIYSTTKYNYSTDLIYYFENNKLQFIGYDFMNGEELYHESDELFVIYSELSENARREFGKDFYYESDNEYSFSSGWDKTGYVVLLTVNDDELSTTANLIYLPHSLLK
ncbi:S-layer homology domain-containing protein [Sporosarcina sp. PTS2304]|uniref:S-layer homology domain-containing protein n=1 Tax=Sporosarcina sp. PTS2304 TaxID=2283194 RepID=UPI000E0DB1E8|nr:S-layer homology domain-containing protein [Sporosarcina sp. PTS2304]AXH99555.1 S-layer homology domain-containing protein [Sporosarcina sp. PTS2304]